MNIYEGMFVLDDKRANENWDGVTKEVRGLLEKHGARVFHCERWDERRLAYRIKGRGRGVYLLTGFLAPGDAIPHIERECQLHDTVLRVLILRDHETEKQRSLGLFDPEAPQGQAEPEQRPAEAQAAPQPAQAQGEPPAQPEPPQGDAPAPGASAPQEPKEEPKPDTQ